MAAIKNKALHTKPKPPVAQRYDVHSGVTGTPTSSTQVSLTQGKLKFVNNLDGYTF